MNSVKLEDQSDYYIVLMHPVKNKKVWKTIKLLLETAESKYAVFYDENIEHLEVHNVSKDEFKNYNYNPN